jgi:hypothetical protein
MAESKGAKAAWGDPLACLHLSYLELPARRLGRPLAKPPHAALTRGTGGLHSQAARAGGELGAKFMMATLQLGCISIYLDNSYVPT